MRAASSPADLARRAQRLAATRPVRITGHLLAVVLVVLLVIRFWHLWGASPAHLRLAQGWLLVSLAVSAAAVSGYGLVWPYLLRRLGSPATPGWVALFFVSQLGKYLPGSVLQYAGRVGLARGRGVAGGVAFASVVAEVGLSSFAAALVASLALGGWSIYLVVPVLLVPLALLRVPHKVWSRRLERALPPAARPYAVAVSVAAPATIALYFVVWISYGAAFWLTAHSFIGVPVTQAPVYVGVFALSWLVGLVAVFAPGGIGVREAVMVALLGGRIGQENAIVVAGLSRMILTGIDLVAGAASLGVPLLLRRGVVREAHP